MMGGMSANHEVPPHEQLYGVIRHVRPLHQYSAKIVADAQQASQVTMALRAVLEQLADRGPQAVPQIARSLWLARQFIQRLVNDALELGLVTTEPNPAHKRSKLIALTDAGRVAFAQIRARENETLRRIAADIPEEDIAACLRVVRHLTDELREIAQAGPPDHGWSVPGPRAGEETS
jgi:DNA-binding MarR family transcriptional regulator